ncbi:MAG: M56 family metallopeptidase [Desulfitobacteriaceae bacterium]|nr:M56 family metallopeptidase [Desulfitobacteriaceae bacterium]
MLDNLFLQILNMSYTASIVILVVLGARLLLKIAPKIFSYALWSVVLFRLICPFSFESMFSLLPAITYPISQEIVYADIPAIDTGISAINQIVNSSLPAATPYASVNPLQILVFIGSVIWILGIAILLIYSMISLVKLRKRLRQAVHEKDNIYIAEQLNTPFVMGIFHPKIYLPAALAEQEKQYILLHEQTHIRRLDHVVKILSFFVLCLHWFNPLVWVAFFASGRDMEMSCDETVIKQLGKDMKKGYSASLLSLSTGRRILGGTPLAFGEGDTRDRIKNVLNYKKPTFWVVLVSVAAVLCVAVGLMTNPKDEEISFGGINADILEIDKENQTMTVKGIDENSIIGDWCILTWENDPFITVATNSKPMRLSLNDFSVGDHVVLVIGEVQESYPTRAKAETIQLQPKENEIRTYSAENLWNARTQYVGNNSAVGKLIGLLLVPEGLKYDHFKLHTSKQPYGIEIVYSVPTQTLEKYNTANSPIADTFRKNALLLLALVDNAESIRAVLADGNREVGFNNGREWADYTVGKDVRDYSKSPEKLQELIDFTYDITTATAEYFAPGDGVSGKGIFQGLFRELCVKAIDGGSYRIVSVGTGGGTQEFAK